MAVPAVGPVPIIGDLSSGMCWQTRWFGRLLVLGATANLRADRVRGWTFLPWSHR